MLLFPFSGETQNELLIREFSAVGDFGLGFSYRGHVAIPIYLLQVWEEDTRAQQDGNNGLGHGT